MPFAGGVTPHSLERTAGRGGHDDRCYLLRGRESFSLCFLERDCSCICGLSSLRGKPASGTAVRPPAHATLDNAADFAWQHDDVFGRIATRYDLLCDVFSIGIHRLWKRRVGQRIAREYWVTLLDGATGTGDIITRLVAHKAVQVRTFVASDISAKMLAIA